QKFRTELLGKALDYYRGFLRDHADAPGLKVETAHAYHRLGQALEEVGSRPDALDAYGKALGLYRELAAGGAGGAADLLAQANAHLDLGNLLRTGSTSRAERHYLEAVKILRPIAGERRPGDARVALAKALTNLGNLYRTSGRVSQAEPFSAEAVGLFRRGGAAPPPPPPPRPPP